MTTWYHATDISTAEEIMRNGIYVRIFFVQPFSLLAFRDLGSIQIIFDTFDLLHDITLLH